MECNRIELLQETVYSLPKAARMVPAFRGIHRSTLFRWCAIGTKVEGRTVKLEAVRIGSSWKTSPEALRRFAAATNATQATSEGAQAPRTPAARKQASDAALTQYDAIAKKRK